MSNVSVKNLSVNYSTKVVFDNFNIEFLENKISVILGESGIGKSTLLNCIAGIKEYKGYIDGTDSQISYIFQKDRLIPTISVFKNLNLILKSVCKSKQERQERIENMLNLLEILECKDALPTQLSGGQLQRVAIARAFLYPSKVILMDEPFKALDSSLKVRVIKAFLNAYQNNPRTVIFVTHAIDECLLLADDYYVLSSSPAIISMSGSIDAPKDDRVLSDEGISKIREKLLYELFK